MKTLTSALALTFAGALLAASAFAQSSATSGTGGNTQSPAVQQPGTGGTPHSPAMPKPGTGGTTGATGAMDKPDAAKSGSKTQAQGSGADEQQLRAAQEVLKKHGMYDGEVDGIMGPKTRAALREFQKKEGLQETGRLDQQTLSRLAGASSPAASPQTGVQQQDKPATNAQQPQDRPAQPGTSGGAGGAKEDAKK